MAVVCSSRWYSLEEEVWSAGDCFRLVQNESAVVIVFSGCDDSASSRIPRKSGASLESDRLVRMVRSVMIVFVVDAIYQKMN